MFSKLKQSGGFKSESSREGLSPGRDAHLKGQTGPSTMPGAFKSQGSKDDLTSGREAALKDPVDHGIIPAQLPASLKSPPYAQSAPPEPACSWEDDPQSPIVDDLNQQDIENAKPDLCEWRDDTYTAKTDNLDHDYLREQDRKHREECAPVANDKPHSQVIPDHDRRADHYPVAKIIRDDDQKPPVTASPYVEVAGSHHPIKLPSQPEAGKGSMPMQKRPGEDSKEYVGAHTEQQVQASTSPGSPLKSSLHPRTKDRRTQGQLPDSDKYGGKQPAQELGHQYTPPPDSGYGSGHMPDLSKIPIPSSGHFPTQLPGYSDKDKVEYKPPVSHPDLGQTAPVSHPNSAMTSHHQLPDLSKIINEFPEHRKDGSKLPGGLVNHNGGDSGPDYVTDNSKKRKGRKGKGKATLGKDTTEDLINRAEEARRKEEVKLKKKEMEKQTKFEKSKEKAKAREAAKQKKKEEKQRKKAKGQKQDSYDAEQGRQATGGAYGTMDDTAAPDLILAARDTPATRTGPVTSASEPPRLTSAEAVPYQRPAEQTSQPRPYQYQDEESAHAGAGGAARQKSQSGWHGLSFNDMAENVKKIIPGIRKSSTVVSRA